MIPPSDSEIFDRYVAARRFVIDQGYDSEIDWQATRSFDSISEVDFLREAAWVIFNSGMRETVVRMKFPLLTEAFMGWSSASDIVENRTHCLMRAQEVFSHSKKNSAVISVALRVKLEGIEQIADALRHYGPRFLESFDYLGPATSRHLAKNLGFPTSKPDRHLVRVASATGFSSVSSLCETLSELSGDSEAVVDLVIWRFATLRRDYEKWFGV